MSGSASDDEATAVSYDDKHELHTQDNKHEMSGNGTVIAVAATALLQDHENTPEMQTEANKHELEHPVEVSSARYPPTSPGADLYGTMSPDQFKLASEPAIPELEGEAKPQQSSLHSSSTTKPDSLVQGSANSGIGPTGSANAGGGPSKLDILQQRIERVRTEKERLAKEREFEEMEAALQKEIMVELRKEHGLGDVT
jgi:hypothetical protein